MCNWIKVEDKLPDDRQEVLTYWPKRDMIQLQTFYKDNKWWMGGWQNLSLTDGHVTHWTYLPDVPGE